MKTTVTKSFEMCCAHHLPNHAGKCQRPHGHNYRIEVSCDGLVKPADGHSSEGMVIDFDTINAIFREEVFAKCDHQDLNEVLPEDYLPTTAENFARFIADRLTGASLPVSKVRVYETPNSWAEVDLMH